jgi:hypothetical protein
MVGLGMLGGTMAVAEAGVVDGSTGISRPAAAPPGGLIGRADAIAAVDIPVPDAGA